VPFDDASGDRLRTWLGVTRDEFYNPALFAILPMGFCYPGTGASGDLPPRPECAPTWRAPLLRLVPHIALTVVIGQYAHDYHLPNATGTLTDRVRNWRAYWPSIVPLPHPSPRNNLWLRRNPWFELDVIPALQRGVAGALQRS
jgi:uracil-DNA glycosylase